MCFGTIASLYRINFGDHDSELTGLSPIWLRSEIDAMAAKRKVSDPVTFREAQKMPCLQAVVKEALRMHPATGLLLGRVIPKGVLQLRGNISLMGYIK